MRKHDNGVKATQGSAQLDQAWEGHQQQMGRVRDTVANMREEATPTPVQSSLSARVLQQARAVLDAHSSCTCEACVALRRVLAVA